MMETWQIVGIIGLALFAVFLITFIYVVIFDGLKGYKEWFRVLVAFYPGFLGVLFLLIACILRF